jgi:hypothetical protein
MGDISPDQNATSTDNGLSTFIAAIQAENVRDPVIIIGDKIAAGKRFIDDLVLARVTAIRGYFDEVFARKVHTQQVCVKKSDGNEICVNGDQLNSLMQTAVAPAVTATPNNNENPTDNSNLTPSDASPVVVEPITPPTSAAANPAVGDQGAVTGVATETPTNTSADTTDITAPEASIPSPGLTTVAPAPASAEAIVTSKPQPEAGLAPAETTPAVQPPTSTAGAETSQ